jgi:hypothetical protein
MISVNSHIKKVFYMYVSLYILLPSILYFIYKPEYDRIYRNIQIDNIFLSILFVCICIFVIDLITKIKIKTKYIFLSSKFFLFGRIFFLFMSVFFLIVSYKFQRDYGISFRHFNSISSSAGYVKFIFLIQPLIKIWALYLVAFKINNRKLNKFHKLTLIILIPAFFLSANAASDLIYIILLCVLYIDRLDLNKYLNIKFSIRNSISLVVISFIFLLIFYFGVINKIPIIENRFSFIDFLIIFPDEYLGSILVRASVFWASLVINITELFNFTMQYEFLVDSVHTLSGNLDKLFGREVLDNEIYSVARRNYFNIWEFSSYDSRAGTSAGFLGGITYTPFFPFNIFLVIGTFYYLMRVFFSRINSRIPKLNLLYLILILTLGNYIDSFQVLFTLINPLPISLIFYLILFKTKLRKHEKINNFVY